MRDYAQKAIEFLGDLSSEQLVEDERTYFAIIRSIEVVGEAAAQVGRETLDDYEGVPWADVVGMRNILIHEYSGVSVATIYDTVVYFLPDFILKIDTILESHT